MNAELVGALLQKADPAMTKRASRPGDRVDPTGLRTFVLRVDELGLDTKDTCRCWGLGIANRDRPASYGLTSPDHTDASLFEIKMNSGLSILKIRSR